ncbi:MAG: hypothetical protein NUW00_02930 [Candidatus Kaiserbacteria bacterium]|nr:hypothetical protein [Candidatus Kaiserbacteria bacterium]
MTDKTKEKIEKLVKTYKELMPNEYDEVKKIVREKRDKQVFGGDMTKTTDYIERPLCEYPANLWDIINANLDADEMVEFTAKPGARWFVKRFNEFSLVEKV